MNNFDLRKYLAESKLHEAELPPLSDEQFEEIAQRIADELTAADDLDIKYSITPGSIENDTPLGGGFDLDAERGPNTPGDDWEDDRGFTIDQYVGEGDGGSYTVKPSPSGTNEYIVTNAAMMNTKVANVYFEGDTLEIQMVPQDEFLPRSSDEAEAQRKKEREMANVFVREEKKSNKMKKSELKEMIKSAILAEESYPDPEESNENKVRDGDVKAVVKAVESDPKMQALVDDAVKKVKTNPKAMNALNKLSSMYGLDKVNEIDSSDLESIVASSKRFVSQLKEMDDNDASLAVSGFFGGPLLLMLLGDNTLNSIQDLIINTLDIQTKYADSDAASLMFLGSIVGGVLVGSILDKIKNRMNEESYPDPEESGAKLEDLYQMDPEMLDKLKRDKEDKKYPTLDDVVDPDDPFDEELEGAMDNDDMRDNMMEAKKDEDKEDKNDDVEVELEDETTEMEPETSDKGLTGPKKVVDDSLEAALEAARELGDEKLEAQIGNTITFFTRSQIVKNTSGEQEDAPEMDMETEEEMLQEVKRMQRIAGIIK